MNDWKKILVFSATSIRKTIEKINASACQIALVVDDHDHLLGTVTDGDIRAGILKGVSLDDPVRMIMNRRPIVASPEDGHDLILQTMKLRQIHHMPIVNNEGNLLGLETIDDLLNPSAKENLVVLMAGGRGTRLLPLTNERPKPLLHLRKKPILEIILENFRQHGFRKFYISVNYKGEMIKEYFENGSQWNVEIKYLDEKTHLGTAGALGLLTDKPDRPIIVMNGDVVTRINFNSLLDYHCQQNASATMCVCEYDLQVPYGVINFENNRFMGIEEKPVKHFLINAGIYVLEPETLNYVPKNVSFQMPQLFDILVREKFPVSLFPIREDWLDIGRLNDYIRAKSEYKE